MLPLVPGLGLKSSCCFHFPLSERNPGSCWKRGHMERESLVGEKPLGERSSVEETKGPGPIRSLSSAELPQLTEASHTEELGHLPVNFAIVPHS